MAQKLKCATILVHITIYTEGIKTMHPEPSIETLIRAYQAGLVLPPTYTHHVAKIADYIHHHFAEPVCMAQHVLTACGIKSHTVQRQFSHEVGFGIGHYIAHHRIEIAKQLLATQQFRCLDVGYGVGYENLRTFERAFKRVTQTTPGQWTA